MENGKLKVTRVVGSNTNRILDEERKNLGVFANEYVVHFNGDECLETLRRYNIRQINNMLKNGRRLEMPDDVRKDLAFYRVYVKTKKDCYCNSHRKSLNQSKF